MIREKPDKGHVWTGVLWLWVIAATGAYLYQFRDFARPILALVGLA